MKTKMLALIAAGLVPAMALVAQVPDAAVPSAPDEPNLLLDYGSDASHRMTVPVSIEGRGPYSFIVDTGAERTVISQELARDLALAPGQPARMHSMTEVSDIGTMLIPSLRIGKKRVGEIHAPALARRNLGAEGILGVDTLQTQRVVFDFQRQEMAITPSRKIEIKWPEGTIVVTAKNRFGHLVLVDASVEGQKVYAIVDTGSQVTVGNNALRRKLQRKQRLGTLRQVELVSVTGGTVIVEQAKIGKMHIGGVEINDLPIAFADVHPFRKLELVDRPAILLGMDALKLFDRVSVDFANRRVRLLRPDRSELRSETRMAARPAPRARSGG
jgi:predicted aspartyl protease